MSRKRAKAETLRLSFFDIMSGKGDDRVKDPYFRLLAAGIRADCAEQTVREFESRSDAEGLERYITEIECRTEASDR